MARQKEHLAAQQQVMAKQAQMGIGAHGILPQQLHHHSSAHSLHSQPSFGSITSPGGYQPSPTQGPIPGPTVPGLFENSYRPAALSGLGPTGPGMDMLGNIREEDVPGMMERLNIGRSGQLPFGGVPVPFGQQQPDSNNHAQQVAAMLNDRARLQREQAENDALQRIGQNEQQAAQTSADRLQQFHDLRLQTDVDQPSTQAPIEGVIGKAPNSTIEQPQSQQRMESLHSDATTGQVTAPTAEPASLAKATEALSLTEQVQKAASSKQSPAPAQSPWAKVEISGLPQPFPPPQSSSPLPAPAAQRKHNVADTLHAESRSRSETPSADTPSASIAPWAKEPAEAPRGPSLKEIQEAEARKAAQLEEFQAAARRAAAEKDLLVQAQAPAPAPGLPSSANWASSASPVTPSASAASAWIKPLAGKAPSQSTTGKKTLQQIQKEEEARKQRAAAAAAANATAALGASVPALSSGKRYADLASRQTPTPPNASSGSWTTVGASGKVKAPTIAIPTGPAAAVRATSSGILSSPITKPKLAGVRSATMGVQMAGQVNAQEEFRKWAVGELKGDLEKGINGRSQL
jgi:PERQ amino acid-rich with GYF domain-containing protein